MKLMIKSINNNYNISALNLVNETHIYNELP
jgi:hypothetical protein